MTKGYRLWSASAGLMLIIGFFLPWLGKNPFMFSGLSFSMLGYAFVSIIPLSGAVVIALSLKLKKAEPRYLLYPGMVIFLTLVLMISLWIFTDTGPLAVQWSADSMEIIQLTINENLILFHPIKDIGIGFILNITGIGILFMLPYAFKAQFIAANADKSSYKHVIHESNPMAEYKRLTIIMGLLTVLIVTYVWCGISPVKLWENRGNAREYLFGRALSQSDMDYIKNVENRAANIEAEGLARESMSNKYRGVPFSDQPSSTEKVKEREAMKAKFLSQMDDRQITRLKKEARKNALVSKRGGYFPPETAIPKIKGYIIALIETIAIAVWGTMLAVLCAIPVSFFAAQNTLNLIIPSDDLKSRTLKGSITFGVRRFLDSCRGFNEFVMALIFVAVIGLGPYAGILALWIHTFGILGKVFSEQIEAIESGQVEALTSTGAGAAQAIAFSVMPQVLPNFVSYTLLRFESNVRSAAILGFVGAGGIGFLIFDKLNGYLFPEVCTMMIIIIMTVGIIDHLCGKIRMKFI